jgi:hypothetical protein
MATSVLERSPAVTQSAPVTHHRTTKIDGVNIFYREAGPRRHRSWCSCTAFRRRRTCSAI